MGNNELRAKKQERIGAFLKKHGHDPERVTNVELRIGADLLPVLVVKYANPLAFSDAMDLMESL